MFGGIEVTEPVDNIEKVEEVKLLRPFRFRLCWLWVNGNSEESKSESTLSLTSRLVQRLGGVRGADEWSLQTDQPPTATASKHTNRSSPSVEEIQHCSVRHI